MVEKRDINWKNGVDCYQYEGQDNVFRQLRKGCRKDEVAEKSGVSVAQIGNLERWGNEDVLSEELFYVAHRKSGEVYYEPGDVRPHVQKLLDFYEVEISELFPGGSTPNYNYKTGWNRWPDWDVKKGNKNNLRKLRMGAGLPLQLIAEEYGAPFVFLKSLEKGHVSPYYGKDTLCNGEMYLKGAVKPEVERIADLFGKSVEDLFSVESPKILSKKIEKWEDVGMEFEKEALSVGVVGV